MRNEAKLLEIFRLRRRLQRGPLSSRGGALGARFKEVQADACFFRHEARSRQYNKVMLHHSVNSSTVRIWYHAYFKRSSNTHSREK